MSSTVPTAGATDAWRRLRALKIGDERGWFTYLAANGWIGRYVVRIASTGRLRELHRAEVYHWAHGVATAIGDDAALTAIGRVPALYTIEDTANYLDRTPDTVLNRIREGKLLPILHVTPDAGGVQKLLYTSQVRAYAGGRAAATRWEKIHALLPPPTRIADLADYPGPAPSPDPLPLPAGKQEATRRARTRALMIGDSEGWFEYVAGDPIAGRYQVRTVGNGDRRPHVLPGARVLPWVLGHADHHGHPELVAYREGLG